MKSKILESNKVYEPDKNCHKSENSIGHSYCGEKVVHINSKYKKSSEVYLDTLFACLIEKGQKKQFADSKLKKYTSKISWSTLKNDKEKENYILTLLVSELDRSTSQLYEKLEKIEHENQIIVECLDQALQEIRAKKHWDYDYYHRVKYTNISLIDGSTHIFRKIIKKIGKYLNV